MWHDSGQMQVQEQQSKSGETSTTIKKDVFVKTTTWKESSIMAYEFSLLKEMWTTMVNAGWICPDVTTPVEELANAFTETGTAADN